MKSRTRILTACAAAVSLTMGITALTAASSSAVGGLRAALASGAAHCDSRTTCYTPQQSIDKSLIDRITRDAGGTTMARAVIDLSRELGFTCIAEGVERESQRGVLDELGCQNCQGYLFARPASRIVTTKVFRHLGPKSVSAVVHSLD
jgi:predicted signal transduction protein with EAL and GGDEF domain